MHWSVPNCQPLGVNWRFQSGGVLFPFTGDAGLEGGTLDGGGNALYDPAVEDARDDVFGAQFTRRDAICNGVRGSLLHAFHNLRGAHIQGTTEDAREALIDRKSVV